MENLSYDAFQDFKWYGNIGRIKKNSLCTRKSVFGKIIQPIKLEKKIYNEISILVIEKKYYIKYIYNSLRLLSVSKHIWDVSFNIRVSGKCVLSHL